MRYVFDIELLFLDFFGCELELYFCRFKYKKSILISSMDIKYSQLSFKILSAK